MQIACRSEWYFYCYSKFINQNWWEFNENTIFLLSNWNHYAEEILMNAKDMRILWIVTFIDYTALKYILRFEIDLAKRNILHIKCLNILTDLLVKTWASLGPQPSSELAEIYVHVCVVVCINNRYIGCHFYSYLKLCYIFISSKDSKLNWKCASACVRIRNIIKRPK